MKKKHIIGLSILSLVLLLGLSSTSYAMSVSQAEDCMLYITDQYNASYTPYYKVCVPALIDSNLWQQHKNEIGFDTYNTIIMRCLYESATVYIDFVTLNVDNVYVTNGYIQFNNNNATLNNVRCCRFEATRQGNIYAYSVVSKTLYYDSLRRVPTDQSVWTPAIIQANNVVNETDYFYYGKGFSVAVPFMFVNKASNIYADVWTYEDVPFYNASGEDLYIGQLFHPADVNIDTNIRSNFYWQFGTWNLRQLPYNSTYLRYVDSQNDVTIYDVYLKSQYINANTLYEFVWQDRREEPYSTATSIFYINNNYTVITNGALNPNATFSGDYKDKYDDDLQNQQDIENIEQAINNTINDTENIDNTINQYLSGDVEHYANEFGFNDIEHSPLENPITTFLLDIVESVYDALTKRGDVSLDFNHHSTTNWIINTRDFITPESDIKNLVKWSLVFMYIYGNYKYFHYLLTLVQTARIDKAIATLGTDEFYDTDIM